MDSGYSVSGVKMVVFVSVLLGLMKEIDYMKHVNSFDGADNAKKGEQACTFQKV